MREKEMNMTSTDLSDDCRSSLAQTLFEECAQALGAAALPEAGEPAPRRRLAASRGASPVSWLRGTKSVSETSGVESASVGALPWDDDDDTVSWDACTWDGVIVQTEQSDSAWERTDELTCLDLEPRADRPCRRSRRRRRRILPLAIKRLVARVFLQILVPIAVDWYFAQPSFR